MLHGSYLLFGSCSAYMFRQDDCTRVLHVETCEPRDLKRGGRMIARRLNTTPAFGCVVAYFTIRLFFTDSTPLTLRVISPALSTAF